MGELVKFNQEKHPHGEVLASLPTGEKLILGKEKLDNGREIDALFLEINGMTMYMEDIPEKNKEYKDILIELAEQIIMNGDTDRLPIQDIIWKSALVKAGERIKRKRALINAVIKQEREEPTGTNG